MNDRSSHRTGVLIVRVWMEPDHPTVLRARITQVGDNTRDERSVAVSSSSEEICAIVRRWIATFTNPDLAAGDGHVTAADDHIPL